MATRLVRGDTIRLKAYAGVDPATGKEQYLYDKVPAAWAEDGSGHKREFERVEKALDARANTLAENRRARRLDPNAERPKKRPAKAKAKTIEDAVEALWKHHLSKLASARDVRGFIDGIIIPHLGPIKVALVAGTPPDDEDERDDDLVYLSEKWAEIQRVGRKPPKGWKKGDPLEPLAASYIHRCHGIVGGALRRAGHPIADPGLPSSRPAVDTTPLAAEMVAFLPYLAGARQTAAYKATRRARARRLTPEAVELIRAAARSGRPQAELAAEHGVDASLVSQIVRGVAYATRPGPVSYKVEARAAEPSAMDLMLNAFALLVGNGPRPVEAAAITRSQVDFEAGTLSLSARGVVKSPEPGPEKWVIVTGETSKRRSRVISLDARTLAALKRWFAWQRDYALRCGERLTARSLVFSLDPAGRESEPISPKVFSSNFNDAVDRARAAGCDLPEGFHLYDMRHFGITNILRNGKGRNVAAVADRFGTSTRMIEERYEHVIPKDDAHLAEILGAVWGEADPDEGVVIPLR